jgi:hypothetical protein
VPPAPVVQAGAGTNFILKEAAASFQLQALTANQVLAAPVLRMRGGAGTKSFELLASTVVEVPILPVQAGASTHVSAEVLAGTKFIPGEPEPVVVGPIQQLPFLTVNEFISSDPDPLPPFQSSPADPDPDLTNFASAASSWPQHRRQSCKRKAGHNSCCSNDVASAASSVASVASSHIQVWLRTLNFRAQS